MRAAPWRPVTLETIRGVSAGLVDLLVRRERIRPDPFTVALRRYLVLGEPPETGRRWRRALESDAHLRLFERLGRDLVTAVAPVPRTAEVIAGPFASADDLDAFTDAVAVLQGLRLASVELFAAGSAVVHVSYEDPAALAAHLARLMPLADTVLVGTPAVMPWLAEGAVTEAA